ncbi:MAG: ArsR/SmtB family transcription factor [Flammeovirgaceae bacterium]
MSQTFRYSSNSQARRGGKGFVTKKMKKFLSVLFQTHAKAAGIPTHFQKTNGTFGHNMRLKHFNIDLGAQIFLACSDTSRLRILNLILSNGEMCITDLEHILEFTQTKTSRHLLYLKNSGILTSRKINQWAFYQIKDEVFDLVKQLLQWVSRDPVMQQDQQIFKNMYVNRELSLNKLKIKPLSIS